MRRCYAISLGALAMGLVVFRGAIHGELAATVSCEAILALVVFACIGWVAGSIADYLVRDATERMFRDRVQWYRQGLSDSGHLEEDSAADR